MRSIVSGGRLALVLCLAAYPATALAQADRMGGPMEFRSVDRPIPAVPFEDSMTSGRRPPVSATPPAPADVLKQIDKELGRTGTGSPAEGDFTHRSSPSCSSEPSDAQVQTTFK